MARCEENDSAQFQTSFSKTVVIAIATISVIGLMVVVLPSQKNVEDPTDNSVLKHPRPKLLHSETRDVDEEELPGSSNPDVVLKPGVAGNFENVPPFEPRHAAHDPGEGGIAVHMDMTSPEVQRAMSEFGFNTLVSDKIAMDRMVPDVRMEECKWWHYPEDLPSASVVIAFHNEGWSPLLRTVHSVVLRSPPRFLKEVILVDDASSKEHLKEPLEKYIAEQFDGKVRLVRNSEREGLIRTRTNGAKAAEGDVVIFLDAHCEVNRNWLPPLLAPIRRNRKVMTVPVIDGIDMNTWEYRRVYGDADRHFRGIFEWGLLYKETELTEQERKSRKHNSEPFRSPTHAGGLFAIDKKWFAELGYYDPGLQIWGGEQYELSFKIWQCGGGILFVPCSHVGHVYRNHMPYNFGKLTGKPVISTNMIRVIKTWMDDYGKYYYIREPQALYREPGDISEQLALKKRLGCKPFSWYMKYVAYDVTKSYPLLPVIQLGLLSCIGQSRIPNIKENIAWGEAKNLASGKCIDSLGNAVPGTVGASTCHGYGGNQNVRLNAKGQLTHGEWCITPSFGKLKSGHCVKGTVDGPYRYDKGTQQIFVMQRGVETCLTTNSDPGSVDLNMSTCDPDNKFQKWQWTEKYSH